MYLKSVLIYILTATVLLGLIPMEQMGIFNATVYAAEEKKTKRPSRRVPTISESTYRRLSKAQEFLDLKDFDSALDELAAMVRRSRRYNGNEMGQIHNMFAYIYFTKEDYPSAIKHYEIVAAQGKKVSVGLEIAVIYSLAQLHFVEENYKDSLKYMRIWLTKAENPGPQPHIFIGQIYYQMQDFPKAILEIEKAIRIAKERDLTIKENWWGLLRYLYFEREDWPKVVEILEILVDDFPKREYWLQLGGIYGQQGFENKQMYAYESAHVAGFIDREKDIINYAGLLMQSEVPARAAKWLDRGMDEGTVERTAVNLRTLGQAYQLAREVDKAIPVLEEAGKKSDDGEILARLASLYLEKDQFVKCTTAATAALKKGGLKKSYNTQVVHGMCLFGRDRLTQARQTFITARSTARKQRIRSVERICSQWIKHIDNVRKRNAALAAAAAAT